MNLDAIRDFIKDEKNAEEFKEFVRGMGFKTQDDIAALQRTNSDILSEKRKLKGDYEELKKRLDEIDIDEYNELKSSKKPSSNDELAKLQRDMKRLSDQFAATNKAKEDLENEYNGSLKELAINSALEETGFDSQHRELLKSAFQTRAKVEIDGNKRLVVIESADGQTLPAKEYFKNFASSEQGKAYLREPENKGAGSRAFSTSSARTMTRQSFSALSPAGKAQTIKDGVSIVD